MIAAAGAINVDSGIVPMLIARILLVDDDLSVRTSIAFALEIEGFAVEVFANAEAMLARRSLDRADCVVVDQRLPGMDGLALLVRLRAEGVTAPAIVITSNPSRRLQQQIDELGCWLVEKPFLHNALVTMIRLVTRPQPPFSRHGSAH